MAAVFSGSILGRLHWSAANTISTGVLAPLDSDIPQGGTVTQLLTGSTAGTISVAWTDTRTYSAAPTTLDLTALAAASTNTGAAAFTLIVGYLIINNDATNSVTIGNAAATQFLFQTLSAATTTFTIKPGGWVLAYDPSTAGMPCATAKSVKVDPGANNISVTISLVGR